MALLGYRILLRKYLLIDLGVLLLLIALPVYIAPDDALSSIRKAVLYSGLITPAINYLELKKSHLLPFFDNLGVSLATVYGTLFLLKVSIALLISLYV